MVIEVQPPASSLHVSKMQRRTPTRTASEVPVAPLPFQPKQTLSRASALTNGTIDFRKIYNDVDDPEDNNIGGKDVTASYSEELLNAFKRKMQELCDETREQYEQKLKRQEAQHERQVQTLQRQLRDVVGSCVSLAEHEQILQEQERQLEEIRKRNLCELQQKWQVKVSAVMKQSEQEKAALMQRIEQLELQNNESAAKAKEHELSELRWGEKLEAAGRAKEDVDKRLEDACRIIVALKTRLRHRTKLARDLGLQRDKTIETQGEVMKCKLAYAELKGDMATLTMELGHAQRAVADEKANTCTLQSDVAGLREQLQRQQSATVELTAKGVLSAEHHALERKQREKEIKALRKALQVEKQAISDTTARLDKTQQRAAEAQLQHRTLAQDLRTRLELQQATETSLKRQRQRLKQRVEQLKAIVEKLQAENKQLGDEVSNRDASTEAWAKKLFGR